MDASPTIINKPIVAKYHEVEENNTATDALGSHEAYLGTDKHGELEVKTDTTPIGVFTSEGYIMEIDTPEGKKKFWPPMQFYGVRVSAMPVSFYWNGIHGASI